LTIQHQADTNSDEGTNKATNSARQSLTGRLIVVSGTVEVNVARDVINETLQPQPIGMCIFCFVVDVMDVLLSTMRHVILSAEIIYLDGLPDNCPTVVSIEGKGTARFKYYSWRFFQPRLSRNNTFW
jgi:hypothetical protein